MATDEIDQVRVTTFVAVSPEVAFEVFTEETDLWWRRGPRYRSSTSEHGVLAFDGKAGGNLKETFPDGTCFEVGTVLVWDPGVRLVFEWRARNFTPHQKTEVEVKFAARAGGTEVTLEHRGWKSLPEDHPARHGLRGPAFRDTIGLFWGALATFFRAQTANRSARTP